MKVIHVIDSEKEIICNTCKCLFSYEKEDIEYKEEYSYVSVDQRFTKYVTCPLCDSEVVIFQNKEHLND